LVGSAFDVLAHQRKVAVRLPVGTSSDTHARAAFSAFRHLRR